MFILFLVLDDLLCFLELLFLRLSLRLFLLTLLVLSFPASFAVLAPPLLVSFLLSFFSLPINFV